MKRVHSDRCKSLWGTFSILKRIDVDETWAIIPAHPHLVPFSILKRIDVDETKRPTVVEEREAVSFSILKRIDVDETLVVQLGSS